MNRMQPLIRSLKRTSLGQRLAAEPLVGSAWLRVRALPHFLSPRAHLLRRRAISRYLTGADQPRVQLGAGPWPVEGWLNSDLLSGEIYVDITRRLPFPDDSLEYVYSEHVIEHISEAAGVRLLEEVGRVLRPGGVARITTPDLRKIIDIYEDRNPVIGRDDYARFLDELLVDRTHERGAQVLNSFMRAWGHRFVYDEEDLAAKLRSAGFEQVERLEPGESRRPLLRGLERHGGPGREWENAAEAMCLEAVKPA